MLKKIFLFGSCLAIILTAISAPIIASAETDHIIDTNSSAYQTGSYTLNDIMAMIISISGWILGLVGSLALLMFVYGGFMFLISAGSSDKIGQAKKILIAAVIGLVIVFSSYMIIRFVAQAVGVDWQGGKILKKSTTVSGDVASNASCEDFAATEKGNGFSCMSGSDTGYCATNHTCSTGKCCHASCASSYGGSGYQCIDTSKSGFKNCISATNLCTGGDNVKCCLPK